MGKRIILLSFAHERENPLKELKALQPELSGIQLALAGAPAVSTLVCPPVPEDVLEHLTQNQLSGNQILVFHFSGHANGSSLGFEAPISGQTAMSGMNLAEILAGQPALKLVFLNACNTLGHVSLLLEKGVPAVIATKGSISDQKAATFSRIFYQRLTVGDTISEAYQKVAGTVLEPGATTASVFRGLDWKKLEEEPSWGLFLNENLPQPGDWRLPGIDTVPVSGNQSLTLLPPPSAYFEGREDLLSRMEDLFGKCPQTVILNGIGGIGKSLLATHFIHSEFSSRKFRKIAWATVTENLKDSLVREMNGVDPKFAPPPDAAPDQKWKLLLTFLKDMPGPNLLVIDNENDPDQIESAFPELAATGWCLLFTTRSEPACGIPLSVSELSPEEAGKIFRFHYRRWEQDPDEKNLAQLLKLIQFHTLLTELLAKSLSANPRLSISGLYQILTKESLSATALQAKIAIGTHASGNNSETHARLYGYIMEAFQIGNLTEDEKGILRYFAVLPPILIPDELTRDLFRIGEDQELDYLDAINGLIAKGWLDVDSEGYRCHPVIQAVAGDQLSPGLDNCGILFEQIVLKMIPFEGVNLHELLPILPFAYSVLDKLGGENAETGILLFRLAELERASGELIRARDHGLLTISLFSRFLNESKDLLAAAFNNLGESYRKLLEDALALQNFQKAWEILSQLDNPALETVFPVLNNLALCYSALEKNEMALDYLFRALDVESLIFPADHSNLALVFNNIGESYRHSGKPDLALHYLSAAAFVWELHPDLDPYAPAQAYNNLGLLFLEKGEPKKALDHLLKAEAIYIEFLPPTHPDLGRIFWNIGDIKGSLKQYTESLTYLEKAQAIYKGFLNPDHKVLGEISLSLCAINIQTHSYPEAEIHLKNAKKILLHQLEPGHRLLDALDQFEAFLKNPPPSPDPSQKEEE
jgi:tetratricopeptide (TPR) repeat protein